MIKVSDLKAEVAVKLDSELGEGPVWDAKRGLICWVDIINGKIYQYAPERKKLITITVGQMVGAVAICKNGDFLAAAEKGFALINRETHEVKMLGNPEAHLPNNRFNDGKCDPQGRFWAGTMSFSEEPGAGSVYVLANDLTITKKIESVTISNGMAWSIDHQTFFYIDSPTFEVVAYHYDQVRANISSKKGVIKIEEKEGCPDGMTIDREGMLWIAHWDGWQVARWNPETGEKIDQINLPVARVTSCTFGGENFDDLYITTAREGLTKDQLKAQPLAGSLFVVQRCGYQGMAAFEFGLDE